MTDILENDAAMRRFLAIGERQGHAGILDGYDASDLLTALSTLVREKLEATLKVWRPATIHDLAKAGKPIPCRVRNWDIDEWETAELYAISIEPVLFNNYYRYCEIHASQSPSN